MTSAKGKDCWVLETIQSAKYPACLSPECYLSRSVRPSLVTEKSAVGQSNHHCGVEPSGLIWIINRQLIDKQAFLKQQTLKSAMGLVEYLFAPRKDHRGWSTPSEAARIFFFVAMLFSCWWSWSLSDSNIIVFLCLLMLISTPLLSIGWWLISLVSNGFEPKVLTQAVHKVDKSKKLPLHSFRKP